MIVACGVTIASAVVFSLVVFWCCRCAAWLLRTTLPIALPLAFCVLICFETLLMNLLSVFRGVTSAGVFAGHALLALGGIALAHRRGQLAAGFSWARLRRRVAWALRSPVLPYLLPMVALLYLVAIVYPPNNYDSLTYHMARVAFWLDNRSVDFYQTINPRQNGPCPGAEYLILALQALSGGDRLANCVQTTAFVILVVSVALITRYLKAPRAFRVPLVIIFSTAPSFVLEATSTQNDLCAAVTVLAVLSVLRRILFARELAVCARDGAALGLALAGCYMVKPTALILVVPLLAAAAWRCLRALAQKPRRLGLVSTTRALGLGLAVALAVCAPHLVRIAEQPRVLAPTANLLFPMSSAGLTEQRLLNPLLAMAHHVPLARLDTWLGKLYTAAHEKSPPSTEPWWVDGYYAGHALRQYEDMAGAPVQFLAIAVLSAVGIAWVAFRPVNGRRRVVLLALLPLATWLFFHWVARNNQWIARYHAPWLALGVIAALGACQWARSGRSALLVTTIVAWGFASPSLIYGWSTIIANELRPVSTKALGSFDRVAAYYAHAPELRAEHDRVLKLLEARSCRKLVLALGNDDAVEYPLTWRALQAGVSIYHRPGPSDACLLYAPLGLQSAAWKPVDAGETKVFAPGFP